MTAKEWDFGYLGRDGLVCVREFIGHTASIKVMDFKPTSDREFATGNFVEETGLLYDIFLSIEQKSDIFLFSNENLHIFGQFAAKISIHGLR